MGMGFIILVVGELVVLHGSDSFAGIVKMMDLEGRVSSSLQCV